jgi:hypothetical protein
VNKDKLWIKIFFFFFLSPTAVNPQNARAFSSLHPASSHTRRFFFFFMGLCVRLCVFVCFPLLSDHHHHQYIKFASYLDRKSEWEEIKTHSIKVRPGKLGAKA